MIFTARMKQLVAVVLDQDLEAVTRELLRQGVLHFVSSTRVIGDLQDRLQPVAPQLPQERLGEVRRRVESFLAQGGFPAGAPRPLDVKDLSPVDPDECGRFLDGLAASVQSVRERQRTVQQEILKLEDLYRQLEGASSSSIGVPTRSTPFLNIQAGSLPRSRLNSLADALISIPSVQLPLAEEADRSSLLLITMKRDESRVDRILSQLGWTDQELSGQPQQRKQEVLQDLESRLQALSREQEKLEEEARSSLGDHRVRLQEMWAELRLNELYYRIQSFFSRTQRTVIFSGWVPAGLQPHLERGIRQVTAGRCYLEWHDPEEDETGERQKVPVQFHNPGFLAPFQMLVSNYSIPEYGTVDPTPFVAVVYLVMFGLMFNDAGQGLVLALAGWLGALFYRGGKPGVRNLLALVGWCGMASIVSGVLFGSYFGYRWFPALWFDFHAAVIGEYASRGFVSDIYGILVLTLFFGIAVIALGLLLNWVNLVVRRDWFHLVLDKGGILGSWIYAGGVATGWYFVRHDYRLLPPAAHLFFLIGLPALLLMVRPPLEYLLHGRREGRPLNIFTLFGFAMEWMVEMLEIFSGYLANTLSFMRVAGLGIAHVSLMIAFFAIADMAGGRGIAAALVLIAGNLLIIGLEGLSAGIQSLRLNYYEFFSKYFRGAGQAYLPISLRGRESG